MTRPGSRGLNQALEGAVLGGEGLSLRRVLCLQPSMGPVLGSSSSAN